jgi:hypothetical protein
MPADTLRDPGPFRCWEDVPLEHGIRPVRFLAKGEGTSEYVPLAASFIRIFLANLNAGGDSRLLNPRMYTVIPLIAAYFWVYERLHAETEVPQFDRAIGNISVQSIKETDIRGVGAPHGDSPLAESDRRRAFYYPSTRAT